MFSREIKLPLTIEALELRRLLSGTSLGFNGGQPLDISNTAPTVVEAENYDTGGEGVAYHDTDAANAGGAIGRVRALTLRAIAGGLTWGM